MIRAGRAQVRQSAGKPKAYKTASYPAPVRGLVLNEPLAAPQPGSAVVLDNGFPKQTSIRVRGGSTRHATLGNRVLTDLTGTVSINESVNVTGSGTDFENEVAEGDNLLIDGVYYIVDEVASATALTVTLATHDTASGLTASLVTFSEAPVESLFVYRSGGTSRFFGTTLNNVFDITALTSPTVTPMPDISGQTAGYYTAIPFTTSGGSFMYILNGSDDAQLYNGTSWAAINGVSAPIAITNVSSNNLSQGCVYRNRLFFVERNSMNIWYPDVGSLGGALDSLTMQGVYRGGGSVLFVATWSLDAGDGIDDKFVAVSTQGEVAVFEGADPSDPNDWRLVGVYDSARPLGKNAWLRVGGDLLILTDVGIIPLTQIINKDPAALSLAAVSRNIEPVWRKEAAIRARPWEMVKSTNENMGLVNFPVTTSLDDPYCYIVNLETGAWARYTGWDTRSLSVFNERPYFGTNDGRVMLGENGGNDDGDPYTFFVAGSFDQMGAPGAIKTVHQGRSTYLAGSPFNARLGMSVNYETDQSSPPSSPPNYEVDEWDVGLWDVALYDAGTVSTPAIIWDTIGRTGIAMSWQTQMTFGYTPTPRVELVSIDLVYQDADVAV